MWRSEAATSKNWTEDDLEAYMKMCKEDWTREEQNELLEAIEELKIYARSLDVADPDGTGFSGAAASGLDDADEMVGRSAGVVTSSLDGAAATVDAFSCGAESWLSGESSGA